jgi:uncharacterized RDD family membrane protein YckC
MTRRERVRGAAAPPPMLLGARLPAPAALSLATPEGVPIALQLASVGDRIGAFLIDATIVAVLSLALLAAAAATENQLVLGIAVSATFALRVFWFAWFEARANGATPGKRRLHLRVVAADGGPLTAEAVLARNFTREVEVFVPLIAVFASEHVWPGQPGPLRFAASAWLLALALLPAFNRGRLRLGDLVAGTRVVRAPRGSLLPDLARAPDDAGELTFTREQLAIYGVYELQVLEDVLRRAQQPGGRDAIAAVARRIRAKIGWAGPPAHGGDDERFLAAFYKAQRRHLEQQLLFGRRKEHKQD